MVLKKEPTILKNVVELLDSGHRSGFPTMIIDDEGDQASMKISKKHESTIHERIRDLRERLEKECLISVTATPYANFRLDPEKERHLYPTIFKTLIPGDNYCGYETFFRGDLTKHWVSLEREFDYDAEGESFVYALRKGMAYHLVSATIRQIEQNFGPHTMLVNSSTDLMPSPGSVAAELINISSLLVPSVSLILNDEKPLISASEIVNVADD